MLAYRQYVKEPLRRVFMRTIPGIDDAACQMIGEHMRCPGRTMPDNYRIDHHRFDGLCRIDKRFPLCDTRSTGRELNGIGTKSFRSERKTVFRSRTIFEKQIRYCSALEQVQFVPAIGRGCPGIKPLSIMALLMRLTP